MPFMEEDETARPSEHPAPARALPWARSSNRTARSPASSRAIQSAGGERALRRHVRQRAGNLSLASLTSLKRALPDGDPSRADSLDDTEVETMIEALRNGDRSVIAHAVECQILMHTFPGNPNSVVFSLLPPGDGPRVARDHLQRVWSRSGTGQTEDTILAQLCRAMLTVLGADDFNSQVYTRHSAILRRLSSAPTASDQLAAIDWRQAGEMLEDGSPVDLISMYQDLCSRVHQGAFVYIGNEDGDSVPYSMPRQSTPEDTATNTSSGRS